MTNRFIFRILAALCPALLCSLPAAAQVYAEQVLNIGRNVLAMDDYVLAIQYFNQAAEAKPYLWEPYYYRALAKLMLDDFHGAEADASIAIEKNKFKYEAYRVRGFARLRMEADSAAIADFNMGLSYLPHDKYFLFYKGIAQASMADYAAADSTLSHMLSLYPRFDEGYSTRAQAHLMAGDTVAAQTDIRQALDYNPHLTQPRLMAADIALQQHRWEEASAALDSAITLLPAETSLYINRAYARYNADDWPGAMADYNYALDLEPSNYAALYNRALLRFQIQDLQGARSDFSAVLAQDSDDFPARYNRGLINLDLGDYRAALADFRLIADKYPRFYQIYYAISQAYAGLGNQKAATDYFFKANDMVTRYTANPTAYRLERPTIQAGSTRRRHEGSQDQETPEEVLEQFNSLVTISTDERQTPLFGSALHGRVQDTDMRVVAAAPYSLTFFDPRGELNTRAATYSELADINHSAWLARPLYLTSHGATPTDPEMIQEMFDMQADLENRLLHSVSLRPIDTLALAIAATSLKNYERALPLLDTLLTENPQFQSALLERAYVHLQLASTPRSQSPSPSAAALAEAEAREHLQAALADYDALLQAVPDMAVAIYGKGCVLYRAEDYQGAVDCFTHALRLAPDMGDAWFNRALSLLRLGKKADAVADLSQAGQAGVPEAYSLLKKIRP